MTNLFRRLWAWLTPLSAAPGPTPGATPPAAPKARQRINLEALARAGQSTKAAESEEVKPYKPPPGVLPKDLAAAKLAMDFDGADYAFINQVSGWGGAAFRGYQYLSLLQQQPEYRKITETLAEEATRKWIKLTTTGKEDKTDRLDKLDKALKKYRVRALFRAMAEMDGFYGRGQLYIDVKAPNGTNAQAVDGELATPLLRDPAKIKKGSLLGFKTVEPVWTYPGAYDSSNPLAPDYYRPTSWYVMGRTIHATRLLTFISRSVPDLLKASYNFGGLSMSQLAEPYVNNWLRTRDSVSDLVRAFSLTGLATDMGSTLTEGDNGGNLFARMDLFNRTRDNRGMMLIDKDMEEIFQFNTPLSSIDKLQAQAQEQMSAVSSIPLVKLLGVTPSGLNASSDGEIRVFYDRVNAYQENFMRDPLAYVLAVIQLSEFGDIDDDISFEFEPLWEPDPMEAATVRKTDAETDAVLLECGAISPLDIRERIINDPDNGYHGLESVADVDDTPGGEDPEPVLPAGAPPANDGWCAL